MRAKTGQTGALAILDREEIRALTTRSDFRAIVSVLTTWSIIAASFALVAKWPGPLTIAIAVIVLGGRQLALAVLMHECAHASLFRTRRLNDFAGHWLCGAPVWSDLFRYREHHLRHHTRTGTDDDPDLGLVTPFPTTRGGLARKLLRDITGIAGVRRIFGLIAMDLGFLSYTASTGARRISPSPLAIARNAVTRIGPVVVTNAMIALSLNWLGHGRLYLLWFLAYLTTFGLFLRVRSMAEHACTERSEDPLLNTRTTIASLLARLTVAPHNVNYHLEHHLLMTVPHYRLAAMHRLLRERGAFNERNFAPDYGQVLKQMHAAPSWTP